MFVNVQSIQKQYKEKMHTKESMKLSTQQHAQHTTHNRITLRIDSLTMLYLIIYLGTFQTFGCLDSIKLR